MASADDIDLYLARQFLPWRHDGTHLVIATADTNVENLCWIDAAYNAPAVVAVAKSVIRDEVVRCFRGQLSQDAVFSLSTKMPSYSARQTVTRCQAVVFAAAGAIAIWPFCAAPFEAIRILVAMMSVGFVVSVAVRAFLAWLGRREMVANAAPAGIAPSSDDVLPVYTILVPLYREANVLPRLAAALSEFDYPRNKLDIKFVVEEDDHETCAVAQALAAHDPFDVVRVPASEPRTKPKACNYALRFARGEYTVIYDAEDRPEADQLRKAVAQFRRVSRDTACLQARLAIYNADDGWLARMFALDYAIWFSALLPGLSRLAVPIPLGGTSNHFRTSILRRAGGWDPFNVTEDADLGMRLAQLGYRVSMLDSTTFEEAPLRLGAWLRQRSRWLKGYMQTCLIHSRNPVRLVRRVGVRGIAAIHLFLGGAIWSALVNPLLWLVFIISGSQPDADSEIVDSLACISGLGVLAANTLLAGLTVADPKRSKGLAVVPYGLSFVLYWVLISVAAYRALWQLVFRPSYWEKTTHGESRTLTHLVPEPCGCV